MPHLTTRHKFSVRAHVASILALTAALAGATMLSAEEPQPVQARRATPDFTLADANGKLFRVSDQRGKVLLLDFWATWCTGCKVEIPWFIEFQRKYQARGLRSVGVAMDDEGWTTVKPYFAAHPINYPIVIGNMTLLQNTFGLNPSLPITLLIDRRGRIVESHQGVVVKETWERKILELLKETSVTFRLR